MQSLDVNYRWTSSGHVNAIRNSCICRKSGIYELYVMENGEEKCLLIDIAADTISESLNQHESFHWFKKYENQMYIRFISISFPNKWVSGLQVDIYNSLVDIYHPVYHCDALDRIGTGREIMLKMC